MSHPRVWEPFLTESDRAHALRQARRPLGLGTRPALVLVDVNERVFGDRREPLLDALERFPSSCGPAGWDALPHLQRLLHEARAARIPVVHITASTEVPAWREARGGQALSRAELEESYRIREEVAPLDEEPVIRKAGPSAFFGTPLSALLRHWGVDGVIVVGQATSGCVRASVVDARSERFKVTVAEECVFDRTEAAHAMNLFDMSQKYADVRPLDEVVDDIRVLAGTAH